MALIFAALVIIICVLVIAIAWAMVVIGDLRDDLAAERKAAAGLDHDALARDRELMADAERIRYEMRSANISAIVSRTTAARALDRVAELEAERPAGPGERFVIDADTTAEVVAIGGGDR